MEINLGEMLAIDAAVRARARRLEAVSDQHQWRGNREGHVLQRLHAAGVRLGDAANV